jgi:hypothetical protein
MRARNSLGVRPRRLLKRRTKLLTSLTPQTNATSFMLRNVLPSRCSAWSIRRSPRYCSGDRPVSLLKSWRNRVDERFTRLDRVATDTRSTSDLCITPITAATRVSIAESSLIPQQRGLHKGKDPHAPSPRASLDLSASARSLGFLPGACAVPSSGCTARPCLDQGPLRLLAKN